MSAPKNTKMTTPVVDVATPAITRAATDSAEVIGSVLGDSGIQALKTITDAYGVDVKRATLSLAKRAALELSGTVPASRGGARADVLAVGAMLTESYVLIVSGLHDGDNIRPDDVAATIFTDQAFIDAARVRMANNASAKTAEKAAVKSLEKTYNNADLPIEDRVAAMTELDTLTKDSRAAALTAARDKLAGALIQAVKSGVTVDDIRAMLDTLDIPTE